MIFPEPGPILNSIFRIEVFHGGIPLNGGIPLRYSMEVFSIFHLFHSFLAFSSMFYSFLPQSAEFNIHTSCDVCSLYNLYMACIPPVRLRLLVTTHHMKVNYGLYLNFEYSSIFKFIIYTQQLWETPVLLGGRVKAKLVLHSL